MGSIAVIDYGMGNLHSVAKALERAAPGERIQVTSDPNVVTAADRVVFPGQGAMPDCMRELDARGLRPALLQASRNKPFLGLCIGLQMLFDHSEEGNVAGLGILPGKVVRFAAANMVDGIGQKLKVPHMGWNQVWQNQPHPVWRGIEDAARFYFVHSYYAVAENTEHIYGCTNYPAPFTCAVARDNLFAVQFHPEKSQAAGLRLLSNFANWQP
jgi:imidazole glycerol-phosphate synthase subunit HisH